MLFHLFRRLGREGENGEEGSGVGFDTIGEVHRWCLTHPRDISGWAFLVFWMREVKRCFSLRKSGGEDEIRRVVTETEVWVRRYDWEGESVEWFLKACRVLGFEA